GGGQSRLVGRRSGRGERRRGQEREREDDQRGEPTLRPGRVGHADRMVAEPMTARESMVAEDSDLRWNVLALGADYGLFMVGLAFVSSATVLPAFAAWLGASTVVIGAIPAVMTVGWFLPPLFAAAHTERLERKLAFVLRWTVWERVPFLVLTFVAFFLA